MLLERALPNTADPPFSVAAAVDDGEATPQARQLTARRLLLGSRSRERTKAQDDASDRDPPSRCCAETMTEPGVVSIRRMRRRARELSHYRLASSTRSFAACSRSPARSSARANTASCAFRSVTVLFSVTYRASQRRAARSYLIGSFSAYRNSSRSASSRVRLPTSLADASATTRLPRSIALAKIALGCPLRGQRPSPVGPDVLSGLSQTQSRQESQCGRAAVGQTASPFV